jgi:hypothetical protein
LVLASSWLNFGILVWSLFRKIDLRIHNMDETIELCSENPYNNPILNGVWETFLVFLMWNVWKEWNKRIFKYKILIRAQLWEIICINVKESISVVP